jgi:hypothetical protein
MRITMHNNRRRGVALLTVIALLSILAVVAFSFLTAIKLELDTSKNFQQYMRVEDAAQASIWIFTNNLVAQQNGPDGVPYSGDEIRDYDSAQDSWWTGQDGRLSDDLLYSARGRQPGSLQDAFGKDFTDPYYFLPTSLDEDPVGDLSRLMGFDKVVAPGILGRDDDGDGLVDEDAFGVPRGVPGYDSAYNMDDDEDGVIDEDEGYIWPNGVYSLQDPPSQYHKNPLYRLSYAVDDDGDMTGVVDQSSLLNINWSGNWNETRKFRYNEGINTFELDMVSFFINLGWNSTQAEELTQNIIEYRLGEDKLPGQQGVDDTRGGNTVGNNNPNIGYNGVDDDRDGETDKGAEVYIARTTQSGNIVPGDGLDNDFDGEYDELNEGIDEPSEYLRSLDNNFGSLEELGLVEGFKQDDKTFSFNGKEVTNYDKIRNLITIYSCSPQIASGFGQVILDPVKGPYSPGLINPSFQQAKNIPYLYSEDIYKLYPLQIDNDNDWNPFTDDINGNGRPDGDFDGEGERALIDPPANVDSNGRDDDGDKIADDDGDGSVYGDYIYVRDKETRYDPEVHVNEDPWGNKTGKRDRPVTNDKVSAAIGNTEGDLIDNDWDGSTDEPGEYYIRDWDDDNDGRMDEDPPEFQFLANLSDYIDVPSITGSDPRTVITYTADPTGGEYKVKCTGVESVRINEVMPWPVIHLEAECADDFQPDDDGILDDSESGSPFKDSSWSVSTATNEDANITPLMAVKAGVEPRAWFQVKNDPYHDPSPPPGETLRNPRPESATWRFENIPEGTYGAIIYMRDGEQINPQGIKDFFSVNSEKPDTNRKGTLFVRSKIVVESNGLLEVSITIPRGQSENKDYSSEITSGSAVINGYSPFTMTFDAIDLINFGAQYVELINIGRDPVDLTGWTIRTTVGISGDPRDYVIRENSGSSSHPLQPIIQPYDYKNPGQNYLIVANVPNSKFFANVPTTIPIVPAEDSLAKPNEKSLRTLIVKGQGEGSTDDIVLAPDSDSYVTLIQVDETNDDENEMDRFTYSPAIYNRNRHSGHYGMVAQERRDPAEMVFKQEGLDVTLETPTMRLYAHDASRGGIRSYSLIGGGGDIESDDEEYIGMFRSPREEPMTRDDTFTWDMSAALAAQPRPIPHLTDPKNWLDAVFQVRVFGRKGKPVGRVKVPETNGTTSPLNAYWRSSDRRIDNLYLSTDNISRGLLYSGDVAFFWSPSMEDLSLSLQHPEHGEHFYFDYVELTLVDNLNYSELDDSDSKVALHISGTPGKPNGFYMPHINPVPHWDHNDNIWQYLFNYMPGEDLRFEISYQSPVKNAGIASPGYIVQVHNGKPFGRFDFFHYTEIIGNVTRPLFNIDTEEIDNYSNWQDKTYAIRPQLSQVLPIMTGYRTKGALVPGQINVNTAPLEVLCALPLAPSNFFEPGSGATADDRAAWNRVVAERIVQGRLLKGTDGGFGISFRAPPPSNEVLLNEYINDRAKAYNEAADGSYLDVTSFKFPGSDDGPYENFSDLVAVLMHPKTLAALREEFSNRLPMIITERDQELMCARVMNLVSTRSLVFSVLARGQVLNTSVDRTEGVLAQKSIEGIFLRTNIQGQ